MRTVLFDLDGTLVDHFEAIRAGVNHAAGALNLPPVDLPSIHRAVGGGIRLTLTRLFGMERLDTALPHFYHGFEAVYLKEVTVLPGAAWLVGALAERGHAMAVLTNKDARFAVPLIEAIGLAQYFKGVFGTEDDGLRKPDAAFTQRALATMNVVASDCVLVGDSPFDAETAAAVDMQAYLIASGSHSIEQLKTEAPSAAEIYANAFDLGQFAFGLHPPDPGRC